MRQFDSDTADLELIHIPATFPSMTHLPSVGTLEGMRPHLLSLCLFHRCTQHETSSGSMRILPSHLPPLSPPSPLTSLPSHLPPFYLPSSPPLYVYTSLLLHICFLRSSLFANFCRCFLFPFIFRFSIFVTRSSAAGLYCLPELSTSPSCINMTGNAMIISFLRIQPLLLGSTRKLTHPSINQTQRGKTSPMGVWFQCDR